MDRRIGKLMRQGKTVFYVNLPFNQYAESETLGGIEAVLRAHDFDYQAPELAARQAAADQNFAPRPFPQVRHQMYARYAQVEVRGGIVVKVK